MKEISAPDSLAASATPAKVPSAIAVVDTAQASAVAPLAGADLRPALWVDCYTGDFEDVLARRGFLFVRNIYVYVYRQLILIIRLRHPIYSGTFSKMFQINSVFVLLG